MYSHICIVCTVWWGFRPQLDHSEGVGQVQTEKNSSNWLAKDFSASEIKKIAARLSNGKAKGLDNLPSEFIKYAPQPVFELIALLFNKMNASGTFPRGWNCGQITLIHKKVICAKLGN